MIGRKKTFEQAAKKKADYKTESGYILTYAPKSSEAGSNGYAFEHRIVASEKLGRPLRPGEVVHHKNEKKTDNRPKNLEVMSASKHGRHHHSK